jgi:hypothetical protein
MALEEKVASKRRKKPKRELDWVHVDVRSRQTKQKHLQITSNKTKTKKN